MAITLTTSLSHVGVGELEPHCMALLLGPLLVPSLGPSQVPSLAKVASRPIPKEGHHQFYVGALPNDFIILSDVGKAARLKNKKTWKAGHYNPRKGSVYRNIGRDERVHLILVSGKDPQIGNRDLRFDLLVLA